METTTNITRQQLIDTGWRSTSHQSNGNTEYWKPLTQQIGYARSLSFITNGRPYLREERPMVFLIANGSATPLPNIRTIDELNTLYDLIADEDTAQVEGGFSSYRWDAEEATRGKELLERIYGELSAKVMDAMDRRKATHEEMLEFMEKIANASADEHAKVSLAMDERDVYKHLVKVLEKEKERHTRDMVVMRRHLEKYRLSVRTLRTLLLYGVLPSELEKQIFEVIESLDAVLRAEDVEVEGDA